MPRYDRGLKSSPATNRTPPLLGDKLDQVLHLRVAEESGVGITKDNDVVVKEGVLGSGKVDRAERSCWAIGGIGREQDDLQVDGLVTLEVILEIAELVTRLGVDIKNLELFFAYGDRPRDLVVVGLELGGRGSTSMIKVRLPVVLG